MPRKAAPKKKPVAEAAAPEAAVASTSTDDEDEWEEQIMIAEIDGVLDAQIFRDAVDAGNVNIRRPGSSDPVIQVANSLYTGHWSKAMGTHIILKGEHQQLKVLSVNQRMLKTEKALLTAVVEKKGAAAAGAATGSASSGGGGVAPVGRSPTKAAPKH